MLAEFIDKIADLAKKSDSVSVGKVPELPGRVFVRHGETLEWIDEPPLRRHHAIRSFTDFVAYVQSTDNAAAPQVFHSPSQVVCVMDQTDGRERATMQLNLSERFTAVANLKACQKVTPAMAINFLRFEAHGIGCDRLLGALRRVDFTRKGLGASTIEHGKETLGRSVEVAVQQAEDVPDVVDADVPVYTNDGLKMIRVPIRIGVYLDVANESVVLRPLADEIAMAVENAQWQLHKALVEALGEIPVYAGEVGLG
jgi:hypothetical protein